MTEKKTAEAEKYLSDNGYGKGTNFTVSTVAYLMEAYAAQQSKMSAEHDINAMQKYLHHYINVKEVNQYDTLIFGAMRDYADDFTSRQQSKMPTEEEVHKAYVNFQWALAATDDYHEGLEHGFKAGVEWLRNQIEKR